MKQLFPKYEYVAKLAGWGLGVDRKRAVLGCVARNCSNGVGFGLSGRVARKLPKKSTKSAGVPVGNPFWPLAMMSAMPPSGSLNRIAMPLGLDFGSPSGITGTPVASEKRTVTVTDLLKCSARLNSAAAGAGLKVPSHTIPFACASRKPG